MTMKNGDMPAMPTHDVYQDCGIDGNGGPYLTQTTSYGLTKREMMAMHMMAELMNQYGEFSSAQSQAKCAIEAADALLEELERTK